ncbi:MAG: hypothetical protein HZA25_00270 [Candidatus Niyogibacteria bacterium]|nr:hypothetical protein [Candidatus Niyogibacteria bacterium]
MDREDGIGPFSFEDIFKRDAEIKIQKNRDRRTVSFRDYLAMVEGDPKLAQNAPARLLEVVLSAGVEDIPPHEQWLGADKKYNLFSGTLFGLEKSIDQVVSYLRAGAAGLSTGKQILLLAGPTASGKSTFANILKSALEKYKERPVYAIKGCPVHHEPLLLLPRYLRGEMSAKLGVKIKGDLCPVCRHMLAEEYTVKDGEEKGTVRWWDVPVERFTFSIQGTRGIGSFEPSDEKSSDVTELVGRENIAISSTKGPDHPLAYSLSGELEKANRGLCEGRELIKADEKLLWVFISVAEEQEIKVQGSTFPHISIDTVVIGHTNLTEFKTFTTRQANEALHDRIYVVHFPYELRVKKEVAIYHKLIETESNFGSLKRCHIAPEALEMAAIFAVLTRLTKSATGLPEMVKLKVYNGDKALTELEGKDKKPIDIRHLLEEGQSSTDIAKREGMFGVSPRDILAALNVAIVEQSGAGGGCLTPLTVIRSLRNVFEHRMGYSPEDINTFQSLLSSGEGSNVLSEYREMITRAVTQAYLRGYRDLAEELFRKYVKEADFYRNRHRKFVRGQNLEVERDVVTGKPKEPDEKFLRSVEAFVPISEGEANAFRGEILEYRAGDPQNFGYDSYPPLAKAVEKKLIADSKATLTLVLSSDKPKGEEEKKRINDLFSALIEQGHCEHCAKEAVTKAREFLSE